MSKFLVIGDPHFQPTNIQEVDLFIERLVSIAPTHAPDYIVILGDVLHYHDRLHTIPMNKAYEFVRKLRTHAPVYILTGNHDYVGNTEFLTDAHWMNGMKEWENVTIVDAVVTLETPTGTVLFVPYVAPGRFLEALATCSFDYKNALCIFAHQEFRGCDMGAIQSIEGDVWDEKFPQVISGHIHKNQTVGNNVYYPGSAMQHAFGESTRNIIAVVSFESSLGRTLEGSNSRANMSLEEVDLQLPRKRIVRKELADMYDYTPVKSDDNVKLTLTGTTEEFKTFKKSAKYKELVASGEKIVFNAKKIETDRVVVADSDSFSAILNKIVTDENDSHLSLIYDELMREVGV
jgi:DNA repair exonuclease SbcCD nuclease subunit